MAAEFSLPRTTRVKNKNPNPIQITAEQILRESRQCLKPDFRPMKQTITDRKVILPRTARANNKTTAPTQITAEHILSESRQCLEPDFGPVKQTITDCTELADYRLKKRMGFEDLVRGSRRDSTVWVKYAHWEESQGDFIRSRSVWERAVEADYRNHALWLKYGEFEMKNKFFNHARNVWDRAVNQLPRIDQLWYKYIHMEEMLGNVATARQIFERWMLWVPDQQGWLSYIEFELRYNEIERARDIFERFVQNHPVVSAWIMFAKFEMKNGEISRARLCYLRAVKNVADTEKDAEKLFLAYTEFEEMCKETERARSIYKIALNRLPKERTKELYSRFMEFEKLHGNNEEDIEDALLCKRRFQYEEDVTWNPLNYDSWADYIRLEENGGEKEKIREVYERAIANVPPADKKRYWHRYIYLWINYALYEELDAEDMDRTREVYRECLKLIPHKKFSFAKVWLMAAEFELRQKNLKAARQILGNAIGMAPKHKIFKKYIDLELQLGNMSRCRTLYEKYLEWAPKNCLAWIQYAELEKTLSETERARSIFEFAVTQPGIDNPELLWKAYIDFEISNGECERPKQLYERLLDQKKHSKVWEKYLKFDSSVPIEEEEDRASREENDEDSIEEQKQDSLQGTSVVLENTINRLPKKLKKRKQIESDDARPTPDYQCIVAAAHKWKKQKLSQNE